MKVGILTFHYAHNYGAVLQAYALKTFLERHGIDVVVLNYQNKSIASVYEEDLKLKYSPKNFFRAWNWCNIAQSICNNVYAKKDWRVKCVKFNSFIQLKILDGSNKLLEGDSIGNQKVDCFIAGSDQIWNADLMDGIDKIYFCDFKTAAKKIFYGASNGKSVIPDKFKDYYSRVLFEADAISVREKELAQFIEHETHLHAKTVCDPTLLLDKTDYDELTNKNCVRRNYLLAYFVTENEGMMEIAHFIARALNIEVQEIHYYKRLELKKHNQGADVGPYDFLDLMKNASFVITNSFHGTIFAILFNKQFYSVYNCDSRKDDLLKVLGLSSRNINDITSVDLNEDIDFGSVQMKLKEFRKESERFLLDNLCN